MKHIQYTIEGVPEHVDRALRQKADEEKQSIETLVLEILKNAVKKESDPVCHHDLDFLIGTWVEDPAFDEAMKDFEKIDEDQWK